MATANPLKYFSSSIMRGSILPVTMSPPPGTPPWDLQFFLSCRSIPHPWACRKRQFPTLIDLIYIFRYIFLIHTKAKRHVFTTFMSVFPEFFREGYGCYNENENKEETLFKRCLLDRTLHENTGPNLCFSLKYQKPCICFHIKTYHYLKLSWRNISVRPFQKKKIHSSMHHMHIRFKFKNILLNTDFYSPPTTLWQISAFFLENK